MPEQPYGIALMNYHSDSCSSTSYLWTNKCSSSLSAVKGFLGADATYSDSTCTSGTGCEYIDDLYGDGKGWPCRDQIGRGTLQVDAPMLFWNNTISFAGGAAVSATPHVYSCASADVQADRDYCQHATTMPASCNGVTTTYESYTYPHPLLGIDENPPTVNSVTIQENGTDLVIVFSELITATDKAALS